MAIQKASELTQAGFLIGVGVPTETTHNKNLVIVFVYLEWQG